MLSCMYTFHAVLVAGSPLTMWAWTNVSLSLFPLPSFSPVFTGWHWIDLTDVITVKCLPRNSMVNKQDKWTKNPQKEIRLIPYLVLKFQIQEQLKMGKEKGNLHFSLISASFVFYLYEHKKVYGHHSHPLHIIFFFKSQEGKTIRCEGLWGDKNILKSLLLMVGASGCPFGCASACYVTEHVPQALFTTHSGLV